MKNDKCDPSGGQGVEDWEVGERAMMVAFGRTFSHIPEHIRQDLGTLERECVIYSDHWIEEIGDFRHVSIILTPEERSEFVRRSWAYELFLRADTTWAREVSGIDEDIAEDADSYSMVRNDGIEIDPPCHCFAAFLGTHLEALTCTRTERQTVIQLEGRESALFEVKQAIHSLTATIRSFNNREKGLNVWTIGREDDVRDLLYVMLRPRILDITKEEAIPSKAGTHKFADLCSSSIPFLIELKWIGKKGVWKKKVEEIYIDIQTYAKHAASETIFFVIVDEARDIPDPRHLERELTSSQVIDNREINVILYVCDP